MTPSESSYQSTLTGPQTQVRIVDKEKEMALTSYFQDCKRNPNSSLIYDALSHGISDSTTLATMESLRDKKTAFNLILSDQSLWDKFKLQLKLDFSAGGWVGCWV